MQEQDPNLQQNYENSNMLRNQEEVIQFDQSHSAADGQRATNQQDNNGTDAHILDADLLSESSLTANQEVMHEEYNYDRKSVDYMTKNNKKQKEQNREIQRNTAN